MTNSPHKMPPAMILCGGYGTRLRDVTEQLPKPMVPIGPQPIIWHIMKLYAHHGVRRFILCLGYKRDVFIDYFLHYREHACDITLTLGQFPDIKYHQPHPDEDWEVTLVDTGLDTQTGGRIHRAGKYLGAEDSNFFLTYGDAVADLDISAVYQKHLEGNKLVTITAVHPAGRFGEISLDEENRVKGFHEKPQTSSGYINGGFMVLKRDSLNQLIGSDAEAFEDKPLQKATSIGQLQGFCHDGFWQCMDTPREHQMLNNLWSSGSAPWKVWK